VRRAVVGTLVWILTAALAGPGVGPGRTEAAAGKAGVKIAFIGPLTGSNASLGLGGEDSFKLALMQRNDDPKLKYRYDGVYLDDQCQPQAGVQAALKAGSDPEIIAAVAHYCSVVAIATVDTYHRLGLPAMVWGAVLPAVTYGNNYVEITRVNGTQIQQNATAARFDATVLHRKTFACLYDTTDYGRGHFQYFSEFAKKNGLQIVYSAGVAPDRQDFSAELARIKEMHPQVVWFGGLSAEGARIRNQMAQLGLAAVFQGTSGIKSEEYLKAAGPNAEGTLAFLEGAPLEQLPGGAAFQAAYERAGFANPPEAYGPFAYVAAMLVTMAIEQMGPDRAKVADYLKHKIKSVPSIIGPVTFDDHGQNVLATVTPYVAQDGKWVSWAKSEYAAGKRKLP
jgi:branched-chain amino acid transport system substrate-binding protein